MIGSCNKFYLVQSGDTCYDIAANNSISLTTFYDWNPAVDTSCAHLDIGDYVCIGIIGQATTTTTTTSTTSSTSNNGISTPTPIQTGMVSNCNSFYLVKSGDSCSAVAASYSISLSTFYAWNPAVGSSCQHLDIEDYVCVGIVGYTATTTTTSTSTTPTNGITTPTPTESGMTNNCDEFHLVQSGDTCSVLASQNGIPLSLFYSWNPAVGSNCAYLDTGYYVCIDTIGYTPSTRMAATVAGRAVRTVMPIATGVAVI